MALISCLTLGNELSRWASPLCLALQLGHHLYTQLFLGIMLHTMTLQSPKASLPACCHSPGGCRVLCLLAGPAAASCHLQDTESPPAWNCRQQTQTRKKEERILGFHRLSQASLKHILLWSTAASISPGQKGVEPGSSPPHPRLRAACLRGRISTGRSALC